MSSETPKPKRGRDTRPPADPAEDADDSALTRNVTGRVQFDDRGNAVWEWAESTGRVGADITASSLRKLDHPDLSLEDAPPPGRRVKDNARGTEGGYSPYDSGLLGDHDPGRKQPARKKDLKRLGEWLKLKKQADANKREK